MKETKEAQQGVSENVSPVVERLEQLLLALRRVNQKRQQPSATVIRLNQEVRVLLEQMHTALQANKMNG
ncbi:MAG: hypothetical protein HY231_19445 [Acidobacteria bacterium]|nr:hypothetical protein [Acidobacteriota bacterium]